MARKLIVTKPPRQNGADLQAMNRRPPPSASALYLMQLRAQSLKISSSPRPVRLEVNAEAAAEIAEPVKIKKIDSEE